MMMTELLMLVIVGIASIVSATFGMFSKNNRKVSKKISKIIEGK